MNRCVLILLLGSATGAASADPPRFAGEAHLRPPDTLSADGRFALDANLKPAASVSTDGRFTFHAAMHLDAKSRAGECLPDHIFRNGFENQ